jgi:acetyl esterase/lipase
MRSSLPRPPYDPELAEVLSALTFPTTITPDLIPAIRARPVSAIEDTISGQPISHEEHCIKGPGGDITISIFRSTISKLSGQRRPGILWIHGGGMFSGSRFGSIQSLLDLVKSLDVVCVSVEYRLAPEHPDPAPLEDCYAALVWIGENLKGLGVNPSKLMIGGSSAGGCLAAGVALYARDHGGPALCAQLLQSPMLDDRLQSVSSHQYVDEGTWSRGSNETGWSALLGERKGGDNVSIYAAPGRAIDLSGLPPAFIEVGSVDALRDENVAYASQLWASGVQAELHVWPGAFHRWQAFAPKAALTLIADQTRTAWVDRVFVA